MKLILTILLMMSFNLSAMNQIGDKVSEHHRETEMESLPLLHKDKQLSDMPLRNNGNFLYNAKNGIKKICEFIKSRDNHGLNFSNNSERCGAYSMLTLGATASCASGASSIILANTLMPHTTAGFWLCYTGVMEANLSAICLGFGIGGAYRDYNEVQQKKLCFPPAVQSMTKN